MAFQRVAVIMAGGSGERFWPVSTPDRPKQFLRLADPDRSLLRQSVDRGVALGTTMIATSTRLAAACRTECPDLLDWAIVAEPHKRNTLGCLVWVAANLISQFGDDWKNLSLAVLSADHAIAPAARFTQCASLALESAEQSGGIGVLGIRPSRPETGYGYIESDSTPGQVSPVIAFHEKPELSVAQTYFESGRFLWNSGMFFLTLQTLVDEIGAAQPETVKALHEIANCLKSGEVDKANAVFESLPNLSFDKAVMEHAKNVSVVEATFGWDDMGSWDAVRRNQPIDASGNALVGRARFIDACGNTVYAHGSDQEVCLLGVEGIVIVATETTILVCPESRAQEVKKFLG